MDNNDEKQTEKRVKHTLKSLIQLFLIVFVLIFSHFKCGLALPISVTLLSHGSLLLNFQSYYSSYNSKSLSDSFLISATLPRNYTTSSLNWNGLKIKD